jgi:hypothetical protein
MLDTAYRHLPCFMARGTPLRGATVRIRAVLIALVMPMLLGCSHDDSASRRHVVPRGAHIAQGQDPLAAASDSVKAFFAPLRCDTVFLNTGYVATDREGAVFHTFGCAGGTGATHGYFFRDLANGRTLVSGRVFRTADRQSRRVADSIAQDLGTRNGSATTCADPGWPEGTSAHVWAAGDLSIRVVADTETDAVTVERSVSAPDCDPSLFARYPAFPFR